MFEKLYKHILPKAEHLPKFTNEHVNFYLFRSLRHIKKHLCLMNKHGNKKTELEIYYKDSGFNTISFGTYPSFRIKLPIWNKCNFAEFLIKLRAELSEKGYTTIILKDTDDSDRIILGVTWER